jgi:uncharacterized membrane protein YgdD (TMEM256/DUF423 family)
VTPDRLFAGLGAIFALVGVALGAFGAHALRASVDAADLAIFETGIRYQLVHALALLAVAWTTTRWPGPALVASGWAFVVGIVVFSGSLYALVLSGARGWGAVTPVGGLSFLLGWTLLAWGVLRG